MPRSFLITNRRYRGDAPDPSALTTALTAPTLPQTDVAYPRQMSPLPEAPPTPVSSANEEEEDDHEDDIDIDIEVDSGSEKENDSAPSASSLPWREFLSRSRPASGHSHSGSISGGSDYSVGELATSHSRPADRQLLSPDSSAPSTPEKEDPRAERCYPTSRVPLLGAPGIGGISPYFPAFFPPSPLFAHARLCAEGLDNRSSPFASEGRVPPTAHAHHVTSHHHLLPPNHCNNNNNNSNGSVVVGSSSNLKMLDNSLNELVEKAWSEINLQDTHICPDCGKRYSTSSNLARHRQTHRSMHDKKARKCPHCEKVYVSMPAYSMHVRTHNQGCECPYCNKRFSRPWLLQGHIRTHTGEKPFKCPQCAKAFADKSNLRAHVQTHSSDKPYVCGRCGKAFALKSYLYKHEESSCMRGQRLHRNFEPGQVQSL